MNVYRASVFVPLTLSALLLPLAASPQHDSSRYAVHSTPQVLASARKLWVRVEVLDTALYRTLSPSGLQENVERELRQAGVTVITPAQAAKTKFAAPLLEIGIDTNSDVEDWYGYCVAVRLREGVLLARSPKEGVIGAVTWEQRDVGMVAKDDLGSLKDVVAELVRRFLVEYRKTHPGVRVPPERTDARKVPNA